MTTFNDIHNVIDDMYNSRREFRLAYNNLSDGNKYSIETKLTKAITKAVKTNKIALEIDFTLFSITILFENEDIAKKLKANVEIEIDGVLRNFLETIYNNKQNILEYLNNINNKVMDIYTVGQSIKIML